MRRAAPGLIRRERTEIVPLNCDLPRTPVSSPASLSPPSEGQPQRELHLSRRSRSNRTDGRGRVHCMSNAAEAGNGESGLRRAVLRVIEDVEELRTELELPALPQVDPFRRTDVDLPGAWSAPDISRSIPECS